MTGLSSTGVGSDPAHVAHLVHLGVVVVGVLGLAAILLPHVVQRVATATPYRTSGSGSDAPAGMSEEIAAQLALLRAAREPRARSTPAPASLVGSLWLPLAVVGSTVSAGVHAALVPPHLGTLPVLATAFAVCATAQLAWAGALLTAPGSWVLRVGVVGQVGVVVLWALSRTVGLPPLLPGVEPVGAWDLLSVGAQLAATVAGVAALRARALRPRAAHWLEWHPAAHVATLLGVGVLALLALGGVGAA